jgi:hypothetical protein
MPAAAILLDAGALRDKVTGPDDIHMYDPEYGGIAHSAGALVDNQSRNQVALRSIVST